MAVRVINVFVFAAGVGALVAGIVARFLTISVNVAWAASLLGFALTLAFVFISASVGAALLMPAQTALVRHIRGEKAPSLPVPVGLLLVGLFGAAAGQVPAVLRWSTEDLALLRVLPPERPDPLGLNVIPAAILLSIPAIAAAALVLFALTSLLATTVPAKLAWRVLASCSSLQAGLLFGGSLMLREVERIGAAVLPLFASANDAAAPSGVAAWVARYSLSAATINRHAGWLFCGYLVALALAWFFAPSSSAAKTLEFTSGSVGPPPEPAVAPQTFRASSAAAVFDDSHYSVRARMSALESLFIRRYSNYDIRTVPPTSRAQFSFSWRTGILRREPNGPDLLAVVPPRAPGLFTGREYVVVDAGTHENLATLIPRGSDWEIVHASGSLIARVLQMRAGRGFASYSAMIGDDEVCKFKWALLGVTVMAAELDVEFGRDGKGGLDRGLAIILAPILEQQARLVSERARIT